jgi:UDP-N-acetylglucosamine 4,6-dehydratase
MFNNQSILITGGTGSFGKQLTNTLLTRYRPRKIIIFSRDELKQYEMQQHYNAECMRYFIGDVRDKDRLIQACNGVDLVVHAAALKHVPAAEYNPMECIKTNIHGAENLIYAAIHNGVKKVIALSSDKAASPINLYGATKLASDKLFIAANNMVGQEHPRFSVVRYGNVVGSRGSVVPLFKQLLQQGVTELPITDSRMTRFWITLSQGVDLVLKGFERMYGGETYVPKIPSVRVVDIAKAMAPDLPLNIIGIRPGEKLHEQMVPADDAARTLAFDDHYVTTPSIKFSDLDVDYSTNRCGETAQPVAADFCYDSGQNPWFLSVEEIRKLHSEAGL